MREWAEEWLIVYAHSRRAQAALWVGIIGFIVMLVVGDFNLGAFQLHGPLAPLTDTIRKILQDKYEGAAWGILGSSLLLTYRLLKKDRKRLFGE